MMKCVLVLTAVVAVAVASDTYDTRDDNIDIEALVKDTTRFKGLIDCLLNRGPCNAIGAHAKQDFPDAIATACRKCTDKQKHILRRTLEELRVQFPQDYDFLKRGTDPENKYFPPLLAAITNA